ncbi:MAG: hypothetical protein HQ567_00085 [Candidatus Nealsonbacteria bacterium]|nr:hypothetical protein [Candidatus Nealsonbacteria bacterium]
MIDQTAAERTLLRMTLIDVLGRKDVTTRETLNACQQLIDLLGLAAPAKSEVTYITKH